MLWFYSISSLLLRHGDDGRKENDGDDGRKENDGDLGSSGRRAVDSNGGFGGGLWTLYRFGGDNWRELVDYTQRYRSVMGISKTEVNLRRLLATAPKQQNQAKLAHYVATLRELLEQLAEERTPEGLPKIPKVTVNDYSEKIEAIAAKLVAAADTQNQESKDSNPTKNSQEGNSKGADDQVSPPQGLRRRAAPASHTEERTDQKTTSNDKSGTVKLDAAAQAHIEKHRKLQEGLTDEVVVLARQLKESSLIMNQSLENTEKILDSTEKAVEHSLASTGGVNRRAGEIYSQSSKTSCFQWLLIFFMTCIFIMVVLLIRIT